ncbi:hypothetical protein QYF36_012876 [Acer negundo]|nr:hypothetical protein QYF36_012876 [Acer negundo]
MILSKKKLQKVLEMLRQYWILVFLGLALRTVLLVHAQNQKGFISIDCGTPKDFAYTERTTGINYISDANFTDTGVGYNISSEYNSDNLEQPFLNVRSFPEGSRSCYTLNPDRVNTVKFLIRASLMYGNYDGQNKLPRFGLLLEADEWDSVQFEDASTTVFKEIIHGPKKNYIDVCLVNTGFGTPFISALELRPLKNDSYPTNPGISLLLYSRLDVGSMVNDKENFRQDSFRQLELGKETSDSNRGSTRDHNAFAESLAKMGSNSIGFPVDLVLPLFCFVLLCSVLRGWSFGSVLVWAMEAVEILIDGFSLRLEHTLPRIRRWTMHKRLCNFVKTISDRESNIRSGKAQVLEVLEPTDDEAQKDYMVGVDFDMSKGPQFKPPVEMEMKEKNESLDDVDDQDDGDDGAPTQKTAMKRKASKKKKNTCNYIIMFSSSNLMDCDMCV